MSGLLIHALSSAERPVRHEEDVLVVGDRPTFGKLDGMDCVRLRIESIKNSEEVMYISARPRNANDFTIGERIFGIDDPVSKTNPSGVIHRILLESFDPSESSGDHRSYRESSTLNPHVGGRPPVAGVRYEESTKTSPVDVGHCRIRSVRVWSDCVAGCSGTQGGGTICLGRRGTLGSPAAIRTSGYRGT